MKKQNIQDERILSQKRKITSEAFGILWLTLLAFVFVQKFLFNAPFTQYAVEFICFMGASFYILIRSLMLGNNLFYAPENEKKMFAITTLTTALTITVINGVVHYFKYKENFSDNVGMFILTLLITFVSSSVAAIVMLFIFHQLNKKRQAQIEKVLNEKDRDDE